MTDHFSALGLPRSPWVDADVLKEQFHRLGAEAHPDGGGSGAVFAAVNEAWQTLRTAAGCLRHFLELEHPEALALTGRTPPELGDLFMEIAALRQSVRQFVEKRDRASAMTQALLEPARLGLMGKVGAVLADLEVRLLAARNKVRTTTDAEVLARLLARLVFLGKWEAQVNELKMAL